MKASDIYRKMNLGFTLVWVALCVPGMTIWRESVPFVIACSLFANIAASFSAYMSSRVEREVLRSNVDS